jgi:hypothetical protein
MVAPSRRCASPSLPLPLGLHVGKRGISALLQGQFELTFWKRIASYASGVASEYSPSRPRVAQLELERNNGHDMTAYDRMMCGRWLALFAVFIPVLLVFNYLRIPDNPLVDDVLKVENDVCVLGQTGAKHLLGRFDPFLDFCDFDKFRAPVITPVDERSDRHRPMKKKSGTGRA